MVELKTKLEIIKNICENKYILENEKICILSKFLPDEIKNTVILQAINIINNQI